VRNMERVAWLAEQAQVGAAMFNVTVAGPPRTGLAARTLGTTVRQHDGTYRWLRVTAEELQWAGSPGWYGNAEANAISGVPIHRQGDRSLRQVGDRAYDPAQRYN